MTEEHKLLRRRRQRLYRKHGKCAEYLALKRLFSEKLRQQAEKYRLKIINEVNEGKRSNLYSALRKLEPGYEDKKQSTFTLPSHVEQNFSPAESAEAFADFFSSISQQFEPISTQKFPPNLKQKLEFGRNDSSKPVLEDWQGFEKLRKSKKPNSQVPGDLPVKLVKEFLPEFSMPITKIYNKITQTAQYPRQWVVEYQLAIPKVNPPITESDTRNIASTAYFSKVYESFIGDWIYPFIEPFLDPGQCGGLKGSSITHYLVKLLHFVHKNIDSKQPHAVLLALIDLDKAFNRVSHQQVIEDLSDMHVPGWLLLIIISYLTERSMFMRYKGSMSSRRSLPGSSPQGAFLGILLFIIIFNGALLRPAIPRPNSLNLKYVDDLSMLAAFNLSSCLVPVTTGRVFPLTFNQRTGHQLAPEHNIMQKDLLNLEKFASEKQLRIKESKTQVMKFNFTKSYDFPPELTLESFEENLKVIHETKLLGVMISDNLKWHSNTKYICSKAYKKMWTLRRMKILDIEPYVILDVYLKEIRAVLELAVPAWHSGLTLKQSADIERVQRVAVNIILSDSNTGQCEYSYNMGLVILDIEPLETRRLKLCQKFAKKTLNSRHANMFQANNYPYSTRNRPEFFVQNCNTKRFYNSPLNYLTRLLNSEN